MGIYLGPSPNHARSVQLVLSMYNGNVLPQIHLYFDDMIETKGRKLVYCHPNGKWKQV